MRHKGLVFGLMTYLILQVSFASELSSHCGEIRTNVGEGEILAPFSFLEPMACTWILTPPPGKKILINIQQITLPSETEQLYVSADKQLLNLSRHCQLCWSNLVAEELNVTYVSNPNAFVPADEDAQYDTETQNNSSEVNYTSTANFHISYTSFHQFLCAAPKMRVDNGYFVGKNRSVGSSMRFVCHPPYEINGPSRSTCIVADDSPVPKWVPDPDHDSRCLIPECNGKTLEKSAGASVGIIVHPGFPSNMVLSGHHCTWRIKAPNKRRINLSLSYFSLPTKQRKKGDVTSYMNLYDGSKDNLMARLHSEEELRNFTSKSSVMILELVTDNVSLKVNDAAGKFGFKIEYLATCYSLPALQYGSASFVDDVGVGSVVVFQCDVGFELIGSSNLTCLSDLSWSNAMPACQASNDTLTAIAIATATKMNVVDKKQNEGGNGIIQQDTGSKEAEKVEGSVKTNKIKMTADVSENVLPPSGLDESAKKVDSGLNDGFTLLMIILSVVVPVVVLLFVSMACFLWYRKQYPVRMGLGRKFETFENPAYERKRNKTAVSDDPAELQKLTSLPSP